MLRQPAASATPDFDEVFADCSRLVWRALTRLGVPRADLPDVCQEVFVTVHRRFGDFDGRASVRSWVYGIAIRAASSHRRKIRNRREQAEETLPEQFVVAHQHDDLEQRQARAFLDATLEGLDAGKREVFVLYELEELRMNEVADALGCPLQTAYSRLHAARKAVAEAFRRYPGHGAAR